MNNDGDDNDDDEHNCTTGSRPSTRPGQRWACYQVSWAFFARRRMTHRMVMNSINTENNPVWLYNNKVSTTLSNSNNSSCLNSFQCKLCCSNNRTCSTLLNKATKSQQTILSNNNKQPSTTTAARITTSTSRIYRLKRKRDFATFSTAFTIYR